MSEMSARSFIVIPGVLRPRRGTCLAWSFRQQRARGGQSLCEKQEKQRCSNQFAMTYKNSSTTYVSSFCFSHGLFTPLRRGTNEETLWKANLRILAGGEVV